MSQLWAVSQYGGISASASLDLELRQKATASTFFHQATTSVSSYGKGRSDRVLLDKLGRLVTPMNTAGQGETDDIPATVFPIVQASVIAIEYANAVEWTEKLDTFAQWDFGQMAGMALRQDQIEGLDKVAYAAYALGKVIYTPITASTGTFSTSGVAGAVAGSVMTVFHVRDVTDYLRTNKVPAMADGDYLCIAGVDHCRGIKDSSEFVDVAKYATPEKLFDSEIGKYASCRFCEENNIFTTASGTNTMGFQGGVYFGSDNVVEAVAIAPHLRYKVPQGYGRDRGEAHYALLGMVQVWNFSSDSGEEHQVQAASL
jgi:N4-gp56 family major capsid protein